MGKFLTWFYRLWVALVVLLNLVGIAGAAIAAESFSIFIGWLQDTYSPFNVWTHGLNIILLLPAVGAYLWRENRRKKD